MIKFPHKTSLVAIWAASFGVWTVSLPAVGQDQPGDQLFSFGIREKAGATGNIRLDNNSAGTTYYSDTELSFGFANTAGPHSLEFSAEGIARMVNDPVIGTDYGFRDPRLDLSYTLDGVNSRLSLLSSYYKPDLAFLDPLQEGGTSDQDFYSGGGQREDYYAGIKFETGLQAPLGFVFDLNSRARKYINTTDPVLFENQTDSISAGMNFRFSPVLRGRLDASNRHYTAEDTNDTKRDTRRLTFGLDYELSEIAAVSLDLGHSKIVETHGATPGFKTNLSGPVASLTFEQQTPRGEVRAAFDTILTQNGRENTFEAGQSFDLPTGKFEFSLGVAEGDTFNVRPIGSIAYTADFPRSSFNVSLSRTASISDTLSEATETTKLDLGYMHDLSEVSALSFNLYAADISLVGNSASGQGRERGSFYATYSHDVTEDWDFAVGYEYKYYNPNSGGSASSNGVFFALQRDFEVFR